MSQPTTEVQGKAKQPAAHQTRRKVRQGTVVSAKMDKTRVVLIENRKLHPLYKKTISRHKRVYVHDEQNQTKAGDVVRIVESKPLSKLKRWTMLSIVERAKENQG